MGQTDKEHLIEFIKSLPDDIQVFKACKDDHDVIDIKIMVEPKTKDFLNWYFGM